VLFRSRGVGVYVLPQVKSINQMKHDLIECGNRHNLPPNEIGPGLEGKLDLTPGANNYVTEMNQIRPLIANAGNFPITVEIIQMERAEVHRAFMTDVFNQLMNLQGDRRTTLEINERLREGLRRLAQPVGRLISEVMDKLITRCILILIRNGNIPEPPAGLQGKGIKIQYISFLVLMLRQYQTQAFMRWVSFVAQAEAVFPGVRDNVDADDAIRDMASSFGVKAEHVRSIRERDKIRAAREEQMKQQQLAEQQMAVAQGYKQTTRAPEQGSLAGKVINGE
jgi:hypothetical protein